MAATSVGQWVRSQARVWWYVAIVIVAIVGAIELVSYLQVRQFKSRESTHEVPSGVSLRDAAEPLARDWEKSLRDDPRYSDVKVTIMDETVTESTEPASPYHGQVLMYGMWTFNGRQQKLQQQVRYKWSADSKRWMLDMMPEILGSQ